MSSLVLLEDEKQLKCDSPHSSLRGRPKKMDHICNIKNIFEMPVWVRSQGLKHLRCKSKEGGHSHGGQGE